MPGTGAVKVTLDVMNDEQRTELRKLLRGDSREPVIPFAQPGSLTRVYAVASGKGGVGKSSVTVNLAAAMAARGLSVGVLDADIYGHSVPRMMGTTDRPTQVDSMILPPVAHDVRVISIAMFTQGNTPVVWRGPMLHRALQQFLADVYWGDLDVLLLDLPPGTGDIAISVSQLIPGAEILVVTTPQLAAAEVAERAGAIALQTRQRIVGVVENMAGLLLPDGTTMQMFGEGGGRQVAESLSRAVGADVPLLGQVPLDPALVSAGDSGRSAGAVAPGLGGRQGTAQASPTRCRSASAAWPACRWAWIPPPASAGSRCIPAALRSRVECFDDGVVRRCRTASSGAAAPRRCDGGDGARLADATRRRRLRSDCGLVELAGEDRVVAVEQMLGQRRTRRHATQLLQLGQRLAQILELGAEVLAQLAGGAAEVVAGLAHRARRPADGAGQTFRPEDHQPGDHQDQHLAPADVGEHRLGAVVGAGCHHQRDAAAVADHLDGRVLADLELTHGDDELVGVGDLRGRRP